MLTGTNPLCLYRGTQTEGASALMFRRAPAWSLGRRATRLEKLHLSREMDAINAGLHTPGPKYDLDAAYRYLNQVGSGGLPCSLARLKAYGAVMLTAWCTVSQAARVGARLNSWLPRQRHQPQ